MFSTKICFAPWHNPTTVGKITAQLRNILVIYRFNFFSTKGANPWPPDKSSPPFTSCSRPSYISHLFIPLWSKINFRTVDSLVPLPQQSALQEVQPKAAYQERVRGLPLPQLENASARLALPNCESATYLQHKLVAP